MTTLETESAAPPAIVSEEKFGSVFWTEWSLPRDVPESYPGERHASDQTKDYKEWLKKIGQAAFLSSFTVAPESSLPAGGCLLALWLSKFCSTASFSIAVKVLLQPVSLQSICHT
jgi:hypothetical protein